MVTFYSLSFFTSTFLYLTCGEEQYQKVKVVRKKEKKKVRKERTGFVRERGRHVSKSTDLRVGLGG